MGRPNNNTVKSNENILAKNRTYDGIILSLK